MSRPFNCRTDDPRWFSRYPHPHLAEYLAAEGKERTFRSLGWPGWGLLYHVAVSFALPDEDNVILEIGTNLGMSSIVLAQALVDYDLRGCVETFEADAEFAEEARRRIDRAGLSSRVNVVAEPFSASLPLPSPVSFAFIDFSKGHDLNRLALDRCYEALRPGGAILFDNSETLGLAAVLAEAEREGKTVIHFPHASWGFWPPPTADRGGTPGMAMVQKPREKHVAV